MFRDYARDQEIINKQKQKYMLDLYRKTLTTISKLKLKNISVDMSASFNLDGFRFHIIVFCKYSDNRSFDFYDFYEIDRQEKAMTEVIKIIKTDDFDKIKAAVFNV